MPGISVVFCHDGFFSPTPFQVSADDKNISKLLQQHASLFNT
jgi:hypothetical protein